MIQLETISGVLELKDEFSSSLGLAEAALSNFSHHTQESFEAIAEAGALVVASFTAIGVAILELGSKGSEILDVERTFEHFSGSVEVAEESLHKMREGVKGTVGDFELLKNSSKLLSAGVKLSSEDFGLLTEASFVLQNRGLGKTAEIMEAVSQALVTGRVKTLQRMVGVIDSTDAEADFAAKLGVTADQLSKTGHAEATRTAVLKLLSTAVADAGHQTRDFGEQVEAGKIALENWEDDLAKAVAKSPVFAAGLTAIGEAFTATFGSDHQESVKAITHFLEDAATSALNFALAAVEGARMVHMVWSGLKTVILGVETVIVGLITALGEAVVAGEELAGKLHLVPEEEVVRVKETQTALRAMTVSLAEQTAEAAKGVVGASEFDKTLDDLGGSIFHVKDAMEAAATATDKSSEATDIHKANAEKLTKTQQELTASFVDRAKVEAELWKIEEKSLKETETAWESYYALRVKNTGTAQDAQRAAIEASFAKEVEGLNSLDRNYGEHYKALRAKADEALAGVGSDWDSVKEKSQRSLDQTADAARRTYDQMVHSSLGFSREALDEQLKKVHDAEDAARGMGVAYKKAFDDATVAAKAAADETKRLADEAAKAKAANLAMGGSFTITRENFAASARGVGANEGLVENLLKKGYSYQQALLWSKHPDWNPPTQPGPRVEGFAEGGVVMVGEQGPEAVRLPFGSQVFPNGTGPGGGTFNLTFNVNGTAQDSARQISQIIMRELKSQRQFGAA